MKEVVYLGKKEYDFSRIMGKGYVIINEVTYWKEFSLLKDKLPKQNKDKVKYFAVKYDYGKPKEIFAGYGDHLETKLYKVVWYYRG